MVVLLAISIFPRSAAAAAAQLAVVQTFTNLPGYCKDHGQDLLVKMPTSQSLLKPSKAFFPYCFNCAQEMAVVGSVSYWVAVDSRAARFQLEDAVTGG